MADGQVIRIRSSELNQETALMLAMLWPALLCLRAIADKPWRSLVIAALFAVTAAAVMISEHNSSQIALAASIVAFLAATFWPILARRSVAVTWCLAVVLVVPLASLAFQYQLHQEHWLPRSARERVVFWAYTAQQIRETPILGIGLDSTRKLDNDQRHDANITFIPDQVRPEDRGLQWGSGPHAHNVFLQTWYELGAVGALLLLAAGCVTIGYIARLPLATQPFILAQFVALFGIAAFSWGMWQSWFLAAMGLAPIFASLAASFAALRVVDTANVKSSKAVKSPLSPDERPA